MEKGGHTSPDATRHTLLARLVDWQDHARWQEFFDTYWRLIYSVARRSGLTDAEAHDVVQETIIAVARNITKYERAAGRFKPWLLQMTRWRIADQLRKRLPASEHSHSPDDARDTATLDRLAAPGISLESAWEEEWQQQVLAAALQRVKHRVKPLHFQIFDCAVRQRWGAAKIAAALDVNVAQVYLIRHRLAGLVKKEIAQLESGSQAPLA
jgi:RNA polymerase sigma factor (sigma-70 family)